MRKKVFFLITIIAFMLFNTTLYANDDLSNAFNMLDTNELNTLTNAQSFSISELFSDLMSGTLPLSFKDIINYILEKTFSSVILNISLFRNLLLITLLSAFFSNISNSFKSSDASNLAFYTFYIAIITILYNSFYLAYQICFELIDSIYNFIIASIPLISSTILLSGNATYLTAFNPVLFFFADTVIIIIKTIILPFILCIASLDIINRINDKEILSNFCKTGKQLISWSLKLFSGLFVSVLAIIRVSAPVYDGLINRTVKVSVSTIPVVGSSLSSALDTALYLGKSTKNGALIALLIMLIIYISVYFIELLSFLIIYKISAIAVEPIADKKISKSISIVGDYIGYFIACCFFVSLMFIFSILSVISL